VSVTSFLREGLLELNLLEFLLVVYLHMADGPLDLHMFQVCVQDLYRVKHKQGFFYFFILGASTLVKSTEQVKETSLSGSQDGLLAVIDGNDSPDVPHILQNLLVPTLIDELKRSPHEKNGMLYFEHTFLTLHRLE